MNCETSGHAKVHKQHLAPRQVREEVFASPLELPDLLSAQPRGKVLRQGEPQIRPMLLDVTERVPLQHRQQAAPDDLDFG